jgi:carboxypeptidase C (cathepsin A)
MATRTTVIALLVVGLMISVVWAQEATAKKATAKPAQSEQQAEQKPDEAKDTTVQTLHSATIGGKKIDYQATAGTIVLKGEDQKPTASIFYVAYVRTGVSDPTTRPLTFAFNGGPGSSAVWLHLGCLGPRRIALSDTVARPIPPYHLVDNESSLLDESDLVFIDPVSTGLSRPAPGKEAKPFHGVEGDLHSVGAFIRTYITRNRRWNSPKFLAGESYGTTRASLLADHLENTMGIDLNGVILISPALNFQTFLQTPGNELPDVLFLPSYTAAAWFHKKLPADLRGDLRPTLDAARKFAQIEYSQALFKGSALSDAERRQMARQVARFTGLEEEYVLRERLRISVPDFMERLLAKEHQIIGRFDSRYKGPHLLGEPLDQLASDPSYSAVAGAFTASLNDYLRNELNYSSDLPYEILNLRTQPWNWGQAQNNFLDVTDKLNKAMRANPAMHVFFGTGYYDLATSFLGTEYTISHLDLPPELIGNISLAYYEAGHMMYLHEASRHQLKTDLAKFVQSAIPSGR